MKIKTTLILLIFFGWQLNAQTKKIDSLNTELRSAQGEKKIDVLIGLSDELRASNEEKALNYALEAKDLAKKAGDKIKILEAKACEAKVYLKYGKDKKGLDLSEEVINEGINLKQFKTVAKIYKAQYFYFRDVATDINRSISIMDKAIDFTSVNDLQELLADMYGNRGLAYYYIGNLSQAEKDFLNCLAIRKKMNNKPSEAGVTMNLGILFYNAGDYKKSLLYYNKSLKVFEELKDTLNIAKCLVNVALTEQDMGDSKQAKEKLNRSSDLYKAVKNQEGYTSSLENIATVFSKEGKMDSALIYSFKALKLQEEMKDEKAIGTNLNNISSLYSDLKQYKLALEYIDKAIAQENKIGNMLRKAQRINYKGSIYLDMNNTTEAEKYYLEALKIREQLNNKKELSSGYITLGNLNQRLQKPQIALDYYLKALKIKEEMGDKTSIAGITNNIGVLYYDQKQYKKSIEYYEKALALRKELNDSRNLSDTYLTLSNSYKEIKDFEKAYNFHVLYSNIQDTLFNNKFTSSISEMQAKYDTDKQKQQINLLEKDQKLAEEEIKRKNTQRNAFAIGGILVLALLFFAVRGYRQKQKDNKLISQQKKLVELKSAETEAQKNLVEEKQKEIIDSITYAKRLQNAILPSQEQISKLLPQNFVYYKPKDIIAGDFYWMHENNGLVFVAAADSTGHGVPGALVSIVCSNALDKAVKEFGLTETGKILDKTTDLVLETFDKSGEEIKDGMDISLICFDKKNKKIFWSGANNQLLYAKNGEVISIKADKQPIGKSDHRKPFTTNEIEYNEGTLFYLMTDGFADQFGGPKGKKFMFKKLEEKIMLISNETLPLQKTILEEVFKSWKGSLEQLDDVTIIGIKI